MKKICLFISMIFLLAAFSGCGNSGLEEDESVLRFYHGYYQEESVYPAAKAMRDIYREFEEMHKDDDVTFEAIAISSTDGVKEIVNAEVSDGNFPDMVDYAGQNVSDAAIANGLVYDLKPALDSDEEFKRNVGLNYEQNNVNGKIYTIHDSLLTRGLWYNMDYFGEGELPSEIPDSWGDVQHSKAALVSECSNIDGFSAEVGKYRTDWFIGNGKKAYQPFNEMQLYAELGLTQEGRNLMSKPLTAEIIESSAFSVFETAYKKLGQEWKLNGSANFVYNPQLFRQGISYMFLDGVWAVSNFRENDPAFDKIRFGLYPGNVSLNSAGGGITVSNLISDEKKALAVEFIKYMTSKEVQEKIFVEVQANPCNPDVDISALAEQKNDKKLTLLANACEMANNADIVVNTNIPWGNDISAAILASLKSCMNQNADINNEFIKLKSKLVGLLV